MTIIYIARIGLHQVIPSLGMGHEHESMDTGYLSLTYDLLEELLSTFQLLLPNELH